MQYVYIQDPAEGVQNIKKKQPKTWNDHLDLVELERRFAPNSFFGLDNLY